MLFVSSCCRYAAAFLVAVVIAAPDAVHAKILECIAEHLARGFGNESLPPEGLADPIAKLVFIVRFGKVIAVKANTADWNLSSFKILGYLIHPALLLDREGASALTMTAMQTRFGIDRQLGVVVGGDIIPC